MEPIENNQSSNMKHDQQGTNSNEENTLIKVIGKTGKIKQCYDIRKSNQTAQRLDTMETKAAQEISQPNNLKQLRKLLGMIKPEHRNSIEIKLLLAMTLKSRDFQWTEERVSSLEHARKLLSKGEISK